MIKTSHLFIYNKITVCESVTHFNLEVMLSLLGLKGVTSSKYV